MAASRKSQQNRTFRLRDGAGGFSLLEMLAVMAILVVLLGLVAPSFRGMSSGRSVDVSAQHLSATLESARLMAMTERTRTRVLLPMPDSDFGPVNAGGQAFQTVSLDRVRDVWVPRTEWNRLREGSVVDKTRGVPADAGRSKLVTVVETGQQQSSVSAPFIEFLPSGSTTMESFTSDEKVYLVDGFYDDTGTLVVKNESLSSSIQVDPLTGSIRINRTQQADQR